LFFGLPGRFPSGSHEFREFLGPFHLKGTKKIFFGKIFVLICRFGVPAIYLRFWVEPANSVGFNTSFWLLYTFKVLNILFLVKILF
jgi:hypothetical protein